MMQKIGDIKSAILISYETISSITIEKYGSEIGCLQKQYNLLFEFLANYYEYKTIKHEDSNQFILCFALFSEMIRKQNIALDLILRGDYSEAAELTRHMIQSCFQIVYISRVKDSWKEWFIQQNFEEDKLIDNNVDNPHTIFSNFKKLLIEIDCLEQYKTFQKLSSWAHPSIESMRSNLDLTSEQIHHYCYTNRFNEDKVESLLRLLFILIDTANWGGFKDLFKVKEPFPDVLKEYKLLHDEATKIFRLLKKE